MVLIRRGEEGLGMCPAPSLNKGVLLQEKDSQRLTNFRKPVFLFWHFLFTSRESETLHRDQECKGGKVAALEVWVAGIELFCRETTTPRLIP